MKSETRIPDTVTSCIQRSLYMRRQSKSRKLKLAVSYPRKQRARRLFVERCDKLGTVSVSRAELNDIFALEALKCEFDCKLGSWGIWTSQFDERLQFWSKPKERVSKSTGIGSKRAGAAPCEHASHRLGTAWRVLATMHNYVDVLLCLHGLGCDLSHLGRPHRYYLGRRSGYR
ncbi:hypothetical protein [Ralstonia pseudosolanacearum]|uniref:hypothetical protein n=1 Tax=Ralstonia pseudosolanacearum TaxID=1310165 RepID=UPI0023DA3C2E|nr:hypothetical protein [Ralstonia pseudosolanacearum]